MSKSLLVTRPNHDSLTSCLYHWAKLVLNEAQTKQFKTYDLKGSKVTKSNFKSYITRNLPSFIFLNGHGAKDRVEGYSNEIIVDINNCKELLRNAIIYVRSCSAGSLLGLASIKNGTIAFIGYANNFWLIRSKTSGIRPLLDPLAKLFLEPSNLIPISLIKGNDVKTSFRKSQDSMWRNFINMSSSSATKEERDAAFFLYCNYSCQVAYGNKAAKLY